MSSLSLYVADKETSGNNKIPW